MGLAPRRHKLLLLSTCVNIGGAERIVACLARALAAREVAVQTVLPVTPQTPETLAWFEREGVAAEMNPALLSLPEPHRLPNILALGRFARRNGARTVNIHFCGQHMSVKDVLAIRLAGKRCVATVHHIAPIADEHKRRMTRLSAMLSDAVIVSTDAMRDLLVEAGAPARKIHVIPFGVGVPPTLPGRAEARARLGLPPDAFVVGSLARLVPHKGIGDLVDAVARLPDPDGAVRLVIGGEGPLRAALEAQAAARLGDRARFLGRLPATDDLYAAADVFALPSYEEGFGLVYIEAGFHGVPSVGTRVGGVPAVIADGQTGLLVPPGDAEALAAALQSLRDNPALRRRLGDAARARAQAEFSEASMAERYLPILFP